MAMQYPKFRSRTLAVTPLLASLLMLTACFEGDDDDEMVPPDLGVMPTPSPTPTQSSLNVDLCLNQEIPGTGGVTVAQAVVPDTLTLNLAAGSGFPNGRRLADPVIDVTLGVIFLDLRRNGPGTLAGLPLNPAANDVALRMDFPFLAPPQGTQVMTTAGSGFAFRSDPATAYTRVDRMGMPAVSTALIGSSQKEAYNDANPADDARGDFVPELATQLSGLATALADDLVGAGLTPCARAS